MLLWHARRHFLFTLIGKANASLALNLRRPALGILGALLMAGCGSGDAAEEPVFCLAVMNPSFTVHAFNAQGQELGDLRLSVEHAGQTTQVQCQQGTSCQSQHLEVAGDFTVTIHAAGYRPSRHAITVRSGRCGVETVPIRAQLQPL